MLILPHPEMQEWMVGWGFRDEEFLREKGAKRIIKQPSEILDIILGED